MDCERLDEISVELAYGELDARAVVEAEQHMLGCERCAGLVARLRKGREAAGMLELEEPSSMLEARILAVAGTEKPPASLPRRTGRLLSRAGAWATRPQIAMAAVLVLMVGSSVMLLRGGGSPRKEKVIDEGKPIAAVEAEGATGAPANAVPKVAKPSAMTKSEPAAAAAPAEVPGQAAALDGKDDLAKNEKKKDKGLAEDEQQGAKLGGKGGAAGSGKESADDGYGDSPTDKKTAAKKAAVPGAPMATTTTATPTISGAASGYDTAMAAYNESRWADAAKGFDAAAAAGERPSSSLLFAARAHRADSHCDKALTRFQKILAVYGTSADAPNAALEGGQCAKQLGDLETARGLFTKAKTFPATAARAQAELDALANPPKAKAAQPKVDSSSY